MIKTIFVDTNIFLSFYAFSDDDLKQLRQLFVLSQEGEVNFILTQQVVDEFWRNREAKIRESLDKISSPAAISLPAPVREFDTAKKVTLAKRALDEAVKQLRSELIAQSKLNELNADTLVQEIFDKSKIVEVNSVVIEKAQVRVALGNPPGKNGSLGDAINWECILNEIGILEELCFVSRDKDYQSKLHENDFNEFLQRELAEGNLSIVKFYPSLKALLKDQFPGVEIDAFHEASSAVLALETSGSFASTHLAVEKLLTASTLSVNQVKRIIVAAEENTQVNWIVGDDDLHELLKSLKGKYSYKLDAGWIDRIKTLLEASATNSQSLDEDFEIPF